MDQWNRLKDPVTRLHDYNIRLKRILIFNYMSVCVCIVCVHVCMCMHMCMHGCVCMFMCVCMCSHVCGTLGQERASDLMELVVSCQTCVLGIELRVSAKAIHARNC